MDVRPIKKEKDKVELEIVPGDHTYLRLLVDYIWRAGGEAAYRRRHPLMPEFYLQISGKTPKKIFESALKLVDSDLKKLEDAFKKAFKQ